MEETDIERHGCKRPGAEEAEEKRRLHQTTLSLPSVGRIEPAVWLISNCFSSEQYFFLDILKFEKRIFSRLATRAAGSFCIFLSRKADCVSVSAANLR